MMQNNVTYYYLGLRALKKWDAMPISLELTGTGITSPSLGPKGCYGASLCLTGFIEKQCKVSLIDTG